MTVGAQELGDQDMYDKAAKDVALCATPQVSRLIKKLTVPEGGIDMEDYDEPEPEADGDEDDPDGIC